MITPPTCLFAVCSDLVELLLGVPDVVLGLLHHHLRVEVCRLVELVPRAGQDLATGHHVTIAE